MKLLKFKTRALVIMFCAALMITCDPNKDFGVFFFGDMESYDVDIGQGKWSTSDALVVENSLGITGLITDPGGNYHVFDLDGNKIIRSIDKLYNPTALALNWTNAGSQSFIYWALYSYNEYKHALFRDTVWFDGNTGWQAYAFILSPGTSLPDESEWKDYIYLDVDTSPDEDFYVLAREITDNGCRNYLITKKYLDVSWQKIELTELDGFCDVALSIHVDRISGDIFVAGGNSVIGTKLVRIDPTSLIQIESYPLAELEDYAEYHLIDLVAYRSVLAFAYIVSGYQIGGVITLASSELGNGQYSDILELGGFPRALTIKYPDNWPEEKCDRKIDLWVIHDPGYLSKVVVSPCQ